MPYFARCSNPNLYWISLLEKAYAKLHGRYFALDTGSTDEALEDLISLPVERCVIGSSQTMTDRSKLFNTLQVLCYNHCIVGCSIDHELLLRDETRFSLLATRNLSLLWQILPAHNALQLRIGDRQGGLAHHIGGDGIDVVMQHQALAGEPEVTALLERPGLAEGP